MSQLRYDIVGSFLRPAELKKARKEYSEKKIDHDQLKAVEDRCIKDVVNKEIKHGLKIVTDGEFRRSWWHLDTFWGFGGIKHTHLNKGYQFHDEVTRDDTAQVAGKIRFTGDHPDLEAFKYLKSLTDGTDITPRQSIPAPAQFYAELVRGDENVAAAKKVYPNEDDLLTDISKAYHDLIIALYKAGCRDVKIDDCTWGMVVDDEFWATMVKKGFNRDELEKKYLRVNNDAIKDLPADLRISTHICRGNYHSTWAAKGGYAAVAKNLFGHENVDAFYLEYDDEKRDGDFEPIKEVPKDKEVVLGLVTSKKPELETEDELKKRIKKATQYHPLANSALSTQCGFSSTEEGNKLTEEQEWKKIDLVVKTAKDVWGE